MCGNITFLGPHVTENTDDGIDGKNDGVFQQDDGWCHVAQVVQNWFKERFGEF